nr:hypothetical protein [Deltaproteobacteria bacterium]
MSAPFTREGQHGWSHDEGHPAGTFHTYDALDVSARFPARKVHVLVPREPPPPGGFPSLTLHDGDTVFWPGGIARKTWDAANVQSAAGAPPRVVIAVHPGDRNFEYTHADWAAGRRSWGGLAAHADYLADEILGFVSRNYPVSTRARDTAVAGAS